VLEGEPRTDVRFKTAIDAVADATTASAVQEEMTTSD